MSGSKGNIKFSYTDFRSVARALTIVENDLEGANQLLKDLDFTKNAPIIGITGPPGAGKSTLVNSLISDLLNKGKEQGYIRPEIDAKIMALMRVAQIEIGFNNAIFPFNEFNVWTVQQQFFEHFNYGICTLKGYKLLNEYQNINQE